MTMRTGKMAAVVAMLFACASGAQAFVNIETVPVGNPGNPGELSGEGAGGYGADRICGAVGYTYNIGKYEVTAGQYTELLNAVAATDTYDLYRMEMADILNWRGCNIQRSGSSGSYTYSVAPDWADRPVSHVSWACAARFANWLHNGQPTGAQDLTTTEDGSYYINGADLAEELAAVTREPDATWVVPTEDEWYKAAYHKNDGVTGNYWNYPTGSDSRPTPEAPPGTDMTHGSANYYDMGYMIGAPYWRTEVGAYDAKPSASPYGTFDQGGNVWEYNEGDIGGRRLRGGAFDTLHDYLHAAVRNKGGAQAGLTWSYTGFRVAQVPEPTTLSLLALGGLALLRRRRQVNNELNRVNRDRSSDRSRFSLARI